MTTALLAVIYVVFAVAALLTLWRIIVGPSILDRAVASDVLLTEVMCVLGAEMAINGHTRNIPVLLIIAAIGVFGSIAVARLAARTPAKAGGGRRLLDLAGVDDDDHPGLLAGAEAVGDEVGRDPHAVPAVQGESVAVGQGGAGLAVESGLCVAV